MKGRTRQLFHLALHNGGGGGIILITKHGPHEADGAEAWVGLHQGIVISFQNPQCIFTILCCYTARIPMTRSLFRAEREQLACRAGAQVPVSGGEDDPDHFSSSEEDEEDEESELEFSETITMKN